MQADGFLGGCPRIRVGQNLTSQNAPESTIGNRRGVLLPPKMPIFAFLGQAPRKLFAVDPSSGIIVPHPGALPAVVKILQSLGRVYPWFFLRAFGAERWCSAAAGSGSVADAGGSRLQHFDTY